MEETELRLKELIIERYGSLKKFCERIDMPWTTLDSILKRGVLNSNITNVMKITRELGIDTEGLARGKIVASVQASEAPPYTLAAHLDTNDLTQEELDDVAKYIAFVKSRRNR